MGSSALIALAISLAIFSISFAYEVAYDGRGIKIDGERKLILSGSIHYPRSTPGMWPDLIRKSKEGGLNTIETYVFWNAHEPKRREYDFSGNLDLVKFIKAIKDEGLYAILRIGPYVCAEWNYGGFPMWLNNIPGIKIRTNNAVYENEMKIFTTKIVEMMKSENLFAPQGGPIILSQIENEFGNVESHYGMPGWEYVKWCANLAESLNIGVPWIMCQQNNAPSPMISACNGWYCDQYRPANKSLPKIWTENWGGWFQNWGDRNPHRPHEDVAFAVARYFQLGGSLQNYYMYHGGTNFGRTSGGPFITTSYDYDAPLDEYGNIRQPKWGHLRDLHRVLKSIEKNLLYGDVSYTNYHDSRELSIFSYQGQRTCFFSNIDAKNQKSFMFEGTEFIVPRWSVTILPDCDNKFEVYNTARVNVQTAVMAYKVDPNAKTLEWQWRPEKILIVDEFGWVNSDEATTFDSNQLLDQKNVTQDTTDYLWVMTNYYHNTSELEWCSRERDFTLRIHSSGNVVHAFVNGKYAGRPADHGSTFEEVIHLKEGPNRITLVSATVGLPNYGANFYDTKVGILGPIHIRAKSKVGYPFRMVKDITATKWVYKTGLYGEDHGYFSGQHTFNSDPPCEKPFVWYKTSFDAPAGTDPVVIDMMGMGKGMAWVNGKSIGRYWPLMTAPENGCEKLPCNYGVSYQAQSCRTGCGQPTQRYYHVPRDWLQPQSNSLVLFEELGGNPSSVSIKTVTVGKVYANAYEGHQLELSCQGGSIFSNILSARFGSSGVVRSSNQQGCQANALPVVQQACLGKEKCSLHVSKDSFGALRCQSPDPYTLSVEAIC